MSEPVVAGTCTTGFRDRELPVPDGEDWYRVCLDTHETWDPDHQRASSRIFILSSQDDGELSGTRSGKTTPAETYRHQTEDQGKAVAAVVSIAVADLTEEKLHLHDDSALLEGPPKTPLGHAWLDLKHLPTSDGKGAKRTREFLRAMLLDQSSIVYRPSATPTTE